MDEASANTPRSAAQTVADAVSGNWVDTLAPEGWRPYLRLSRADRPIGTWLLYIPCLWAVALAAGATGWRLVDLWLIAGSGIGAFLMRGAGCTWNDIQDRDFDAKVTRTRSRPIPSGAVTVTRAVAWMVAQALAAFLILLTFNWTAIGWGIASLVFVAIYPFAKRFTWWPQVFLGLAFNWGALLLWVAHTGSIGLPAVLLYLAGIAWTLHYDTIYAHQDREDDALIGVKSTARLFGAATPGWLWGFANAAIVLAAAAVLTAGGGPLGFLGVAAFGAHMAWQILRLRMDDPARCLALFRATRWGGLALFAGLVADSLM
ncbi:4-hydroxybenzoate octaprenyltransferase [Limibaculum sp. FT325]|uniref:4-hydroxybenzoate octaprenyltransferase n=1 Tax=Thermohalobaculum sediminis TaxID=2939436 RepID=UPI0020BF7996|nr:4-hydroxybenzoate octaprenyltransferase [Limibaculum sediminis]MCL5776022.1 4-hydroxybenzoate octaprenyltransferase [Limibaculum sediminis]